MSKEEFSEKEIKDAIEIVDIVNKLPIEKKMQVLGYAQGLTASTELRQRPQPN